jgi:hypothetical protein
MRIAAKVRDLGAALSPCQHEDHETNNTEHPFPGAHAGNRRDEDDDRGHCRDCQTETQPFENRRHRLKKSGRSFFVSRRNLDDGCKVVRREHRVWLS